MAPGHQCRGSYKKRADRVPVMTVRWGGTSFGCCFVDRATYVIVESRSHWLQEKRGEGFSSHWLLFCLTKISRMPGSERIVANGSSGGCRISQTGERQPLRRRQKPIILPDFCRKLHENERNWTRGRTSLAPPLGSANVLLFLRE